MGSRRDPNEKFSVGNHVVCLIDLLGQKAKLAKWSQLPEGLQPKPDFVQALKQTAGTVLQFQQIFEDFFGQFAVPGISMDLIKALPQEKQELFWRHRDCRLGTQQFADTFVFYAPVTNAYGDVSFEPVYRILVACAMAMTCSLAVGLPMRGALCVGLGMQLEERNFYGPALAEAHHLESEVAQHPRVILSPEAENFLKGNAGFSTEPLIEQSMTELAKVCRSFLCYDSDDKGMVDFLGQGIHDVVGRPDPGLVETIEKAYLFVRSELARFWAEGNVKLATRYARLHDYMKARLPIWNLQHLLEDGA